MGRRYAAGPSNGTCKGPKCSRETPTLAADYCSPGCESAAQEQKMKAEKYENEGN